MSGARARSFLANVIVGVVVVIVALWLLRGVVRTFLWLVSVAALVAVVIALLWLAGRIRKG